MWFKKHACPICLEKDHRIADLKAQIAKLETLIYPNNDPGQLPGIKYEADGVLSAQQHVTDLSEPTAADLAIMSSPDETLSEASRLLSGNY